MPLFTFEQKEKLKAVGKKVLDIFKVCNDIVTKVPKKDDSIYEKTVKCAAIVESAYRVAIQTQEFKSEKLDRFIFKKYKARQVRSHFLSKLIVTSGILYDFNIESENLPQYETILQHIIIGNERIIFVQRNIKDDMTENSYLYEFYATANFEYPKLFEKLWERNGNAIAVDTVIDKTYDQDIRLTPFTVDLPFASKQTRDKIIELEDFKIGNCALLVGLPGTGKSSACHYFATNLNKKLFKFTGTAFGSGSMADVCNLIDFLAPDVVLIDDADRTNLSSANSQSLYLFEVFHQKLENVLFLLTANYPQRIEKALLRTGRIDNIVEFELPTDEEKKEIFNFFIKTPLDEEIMKKLIQTATDQKMGHADVVGFAKKVNKYGFDLAVKAMQRLTNYRDKGKCYGNDDDD